MGDYFGEIALLSGEPRKASVYAIGKSTCLYISRPTFLRVLGPLQSLLERNIGKYEKYADAMKSAAAETSSAADGKHHEEDDFEGGMPGTAVKKKVNRKRDRPSDNMDLLDKNKSVGKDLPSEAEPETLADKVAADFKNPALVTPSSSFVVESL